MSEYNYVEKLVKKYKTRSPYELADRMGFKIHRANIGNIWGYYHKVYRIKNIVLNEMLTPNSPEEKYVLAHEIGHSIMHPNANTPFLRSNTYISVDRMEIQANRFAMILLISDTDITEALAEYQYSRGQLSRLWGYHKELVDLRLENFKLEELT